MWCRRRAPSPRPLSATFRTCLFVIFIALIIRGAIRLVKLFFHQIEEGKIVFKNFPAEWADPTYKIARLLLVAFGLIVAFPYLPASDSAAFAGVSVFMGVLFSLSSSSAISNAIAGVVLTYTGAFRLGERVKLGETFGDIVEMSMLATRIRTIKNEDITIPNSLVLGGAMTNYSRQAKELGLILHTSVTIGYDAPWRKIHGLLIDAALATPHILETPKPFVWQTALNDFYVTYEINAYTANARDMIETYAVLHAQHPGQVLRRGRRDHVAALHLDPRRQHGADTGSPAAARLPHTRIPRRAGRGGIDYEAPLMTADEVLARLIEGNERFVRGEARFPTVQKEILADLAKGQHPVRDHPRLQRFARAAGAGLRCRLRRAVHRARGRQRHLCRDHGDAAVRGHAPANAALCRDGAQGLRCSVGRTGNKGPRRLASCSNCVAA